MDIKTTKLELLRIIMGIENPGLLERISTLVKSETTDFWDDLTPVQQKEIDQAIQELNSGKGIEWKEFKNSIV